VATKNFDLALYQKGGTDSEKLALVLPGLLDTKDYLHIQRHVNLLANLGFLAVSFDPPGTWESGEDPHLYTSSNYLEAIDELVDYFDQRPVFVAGHSLGGRMAMVAAAKNPAIEAFAAIMAANKFIRPDNYEERVVRWRRNRTKVITRDLPNDPKQKKQFELPYSFSKDARQYDALGRLRTLKKPKLFIAGKADDRVSPETVSNIFEEAAAPKEIKMIDYGHDYRRSRAAIEEVGKHIRNFVVEQGLIS
jgi:pimeloyl-ACP methyl ester carboxylesterase